MQLLCFISLCFYSLSVNTGHVCVSSQSGEQRNALCITVTQQLMVVQWSSFTWEWKQVWHFREVAATENISNPIYHIISITTAVRRFSNTYIYLLFSYLSNHHPAHSCTPWADMFHISVGHARQPTQRVSLLALQIRAERAVIASGGHRERDGKELFCFGFPLSDPTRFKLRSPLDSAQSQQWKWVVDISPDTAKSRRDANKRFQRAVVLLLRCVWKAFYFIITHLLILLQDSKQN